MTPEGEGNQKTWVGWLQIAAIFAVVLFAIFLTLSLSRNEAPTAGYTNGDNQQAVPVQVIRPDPVSHRIEVSTTGTVTARAMVALTAQVGGRVISVSDAVRGGGHFEAGDILFSIDPSDYEIAVIRAEAALAEARSAYAQTQADADLARREWEESFPDQEITPLAAREPQLEAARSRVLSAQAELAQAGLNLDRTQVAFPYAGRIVESRIEEGLLLIAGQSYGMAYNSSQLEIVAPVAPDDLARLEGAVGRSVDIVFESGETLTGQVIREGADLDNRSRFIDLFIRAIDPTSLRPGLFAEILITGETIGEVFRLPPNSVSGLNSAHIVRDGVIEPISVDVIERGHEFIVTRPFDSADGLIISPLPADVDGRVADIQQASPVGVSGSSDGSGASEE